LDGAKLHHWAAKEAASATTKAAVCRGLVHRVDCGIFDVNALREVECVEGAVAQPLAERVSGDRCGVLSVERHASRRTGACCRVPTVLKGAEGEHGEFDEHEHDVHLRRRSGAPDAARLGLCGCRSETFEPDSPPQCCSRGGLRTV